MNKKIEAMSDARIKAAIENAQKGISQYIEIMKMFVQVDDVSKCCAFQRLYEYFYRVTPRQPEWYGTYYKTLQEGKTNPNINFECVLNRLLLYGKCEFSFSSKLIATINPKMPPWDSKVKKFTGFNMPRSRTRDRINVAAKTYQNLVNCYCKFLQSDNGIRCLNLFDEKVYEYDKNIDLGKITKVKKIDFILWKYR